MAPDIATTTTTTKVVLKSFAPLNKTGNPFFPLQKKEENVVVVAEQMEALTFCDDFVGCGWWWWSEGWGCGRGMGVEEDCIEGVKNTCREL